VLADNATQLHQPPATCAAARERDAPPQALHLLHRPMCLAPPELKERKPWCSGLLRAPTRHAVLTERHA
jgi:hypothetical protein